MSEIHLIAAQSKNRVIGLNGTMPWHLPRDLSHFKERTMNFPVIMGRKTFDSIKKKLPNRTNIIITNNSDYKADGCSIFNNLEQAIAAYQKYDKIFIIGGANIYTQTIDIADFLDISWIDVELEGDSFFPIIDQNIWEEFQRTEYKKDDKNQYNINFVDYRRRKK